MTIDFMETFAAKVEASGLASRWSIRGCTDGEVRRLEKHFEIRLPKAYVAFLRAMGRGAGRFMQGTDMFFDSVFNNRVAAEEALERQGYPFDLSREAFVFSSHQGYIFHLFDWDTHLDDPPVYGFAEGEVSLTHVSDSFTEFLSRILDEEVRNWNF